MKFSLNLGMFYNLTDKFFNKDIVTIQGQKIWRKTGYKLLVVLFPFVIQSESMLSGPMIENALVINNKTDNLDIQPHGTPMKHWYIVASGLSCQLTSLPEYPVNGKKRNNFYAIPSLFFNVHSERFRIGLRDLTILSSSYDNNLFGSISAFCLSPSIGGHIPVYSVKYDGMILLGLEGGNNFQIQYGSNNWSALSSIPYIMIYVNGIVWSDIPIFKQIGLEISTRLNYAYKGFALCGYKLPLPEKSIWIQSGIAVSFGLFKMRNR